MVQLFRFLEAVRAGFAEVISAEILTKAQFYDLDPMQIVWHGNYARFFEQARCALLDKIDFNYDAMAATGYGWPIVDMRIKYVKPIKFAQEIIVRATLTEYENRLRIEYRIFDAGSGEALTKGETVQVAVEMATTEIQFISPPQLVAKVRPHL